MSSGACPEVWGVIPAAGTGRRFGSDRPKQFLRIAGRSVLEHSLQAVMGHRRVSGAVVALSTAEQSWRPTRDFNPKPLRIIAGGAQRAQTVLAGLNRLCADETAPDAWVLVHDAARPCLSPSDLDRLLDSLESDPLGGILAVPVADTLKRCNARGVIVETVERSELWQAQTPQMFRLGPLRDVLTCALEAGVSVTDEASAMEWAGHHPKIVPGSRTNLKITHSEDLWLAEALLRREFDLD